MRKSGGISYVKDGSLWARGMNPLEAPAINLLLGILVGACVLGLLVGLLVAFRLGATAWWLVGLGGLAGALVFYLIASILARPLIEYLFEEKVQRMMSTTPAGTEAISIVQDPQLFRNEDKQFKPHFPWVTPLTLGVIKIYRLHLDGDRVYLVNVGFNNIYIYNQSQAYQGRKVFWKLNLGTEMPLTAVSALHQGERIVDIKAIPSYDSTFDAGKGLGGWVTLDYKVTIKYKIEDIERVQQTFNPLESIEDAVRRAARRTLPFGSYANARVVLAQDEIERQIKSDPKVLATGVTITSLMVKDVKDSAQLNELMRQSFDRLIKASDRRQIALQFETMDREMFQRMIEAEEPRAALELRGRAANQMMDALLASGWDPMKAYLESSKAAQGISKPDSIAGLVADMSLKRIKDEDWPPLNIPAGLNWAARMRWEREQMEARAPHLLQPLTAENEFQFVLESGRTLTITWVYHDVHLPPRVSIDGHERTDGFVLLSPGIYDYNKVTVWDLFVYARRLPGV